MFQSSLVPDRTLLEVSHIVQTKLDSVRDAILATFRDEQDRQLSLPPEWKHAIRIIESRKRMWRRILASNSSIPMLRDRAIAELGLKSKDHGEQIEFANSKHGIGRLDCMACDFEYTELNGFPAQLPLSKVCPHCHGGVLHVKTRGEWPEGTTVEHGTSETKPAYFRYAKCDWCGFESREAVTE